MNEQGINTLPAQDISSLVKYLNNGSSAAPVSTFDPFNTKIYGKDQSRVPQGIPNLPPGAVKPQSELQAPVQLAGDVLPLPITPGPNAGHTNQAADYMWGNKTAPNISPLSPDFQILMDILKRKANKYKQS